MVLYSITSFMQISWSEKEKKPDNTTGIKRCWKGGKQKKFEKSGTAPGQPPGQGNSLGALAQLQSKNSQWGFLPVSISSPRKDKEELVSNEHERASCQGKKQSRGEPWNIRKNMGTFQFRNLRMRDFQIVRFLLNRRVLGIGRTMIFIY